MASKLWYTARINSGMPMIVMLFHDQLVLRINRHLRVVADRGLCMRDYCTCIRVGLRDLIFAAGVQLLQRRLLSLPPLKHPDGLRYAFILPDQVARGNLKPLRNSQTLATRDEMHLRFHY